MQTKIYHVSIPNENANLVTKNIKLLQSSYEELPVAGKIIIGGVGGVALGLAAVTLAPVELAAATLVAGATAGAAVIAAVTGMVSDEEPGGVNKIISDNEKQALEKIFGVDLHNGQFYLTHPKRSDYLIPAQSFYDYIINEQAADLITMIKSAVPAKEICIQINVDEPVEFELLSSKVGSSFGLKREKSTTLQIRIEAGGSIVDDGRKIVWDNFIPVVQRGLQDKTLKSLTFNHKSKIGLGIKAVMMKNVGLSINVGKEQHYGISVRC
jgi:hypothetical protein